VLEPAPVRALPAAVGRGISRCLCSSFRFGSSDHTETLAAYHLILLRGIAERSLIPSVRVVDASTTPARYACAPGVLCARGRGAGR